MPHFPVKIKECGFRAQRPTATRADLCPAKVARRRHVGEGLHFQLIAGTQELAFTLSEAVLPDQWDALIVLET